MTISQLKNALETSVTQELKNNLQGDVNVITEYDVNNEVIRSELHIVAPRAENSNRSNIICYDIEFHEANNDISILAFNRVYLYDTLGVSIVNNEPVPVSRAFLEAMGTIISLGMDKVYHPENYSVLTEDSDESEIEE